MKAQIDTKLPNVVVRLKIIISSPKGPRARLHLLFNDAILTLTAMKNQVRFAKTIIPLGIGATEHSLLIQTKTTAGIGIKILHHDPKLCQLLMTLDPKRFLTQIIQLLPHRGDAIIPGDIAKGYSYVRIGLILLAYLYIFSIIFNSLKDFDLGEQTHCGKSLRKEV